MYATFHAEATVFLSTHPCSIRGQSYPLHKKDDVHPLIRKNRKGLRRVQEVQFNPSNHSSTGVRAAGGIRVKPLSPVEGQSSVSVSNDDHLGEETPRFT